MNWDKDDDKEKKQKDQDYVSGDNPYEIPDMVANYKQKYNLLTHKEIESVINDCMEKIGPPFPRDTVEKCVEKNLKTKQAVREIAQKI